MDWRILAVAAAVMAVLAGGSLLAAQTERDLAGEIAHKDLGRFERPEGAPLQPNGFQLPKDLPIDLPEGTKISLDGTSLTLPKDMDLKLPDDLDLSGLDLALPEDFDLKLPEGTKLDLEGLELPEGGEIALPDGSRFQLPKGSRLDLPPEVIDALRRQGMRLGELDGATEFGLRGLPEGLQARLDPPSFEGEGELSLPANTTIRLPEGQRLPFPPGALLAAGMRYLLPAGSEFDIPYGAGDGYAQGMYPVPGPATPQGPRGTRPIDTEIDALPSKARKTDPIRLQGHVRDGVNGQALAGRVVEIYLNATKAEPGVLVGRGVSDARGLFDITVRIPEDWPAREYQLVNRAPGDETYADGWGDPPIATYAATRITLELPAREGAGARIPIAGDLVDETELAVAGALVTVVADGTPVATALTGLDGRYNTSIVLPAGRHTVEARYAGNATFEPSTARSALDVDALALDVPVGLRARPGDPVAFTARLTNNGTPAIGRVVDLALPWGETQRATTDARGEFAVSTAIPSSTLPGPLRFDYVVSGTPGLAKSQPVDVFVRAHFEMDAPKRADAGVGIPISGRLVDERGVGVLGQTVRMTVSGPGGSGEAAALSSTDGAFEAKPATPRAVAGDHTLTTTLAPLSRYVEIAPDRRTILLGVFAVDWDTPPRAIRGETVTLGGTATLDGAPVVHGAFTLDAWGEHAITTDDDGSFSVDARVPKDAQLGATQLVLRSSEHTPREQTLRVVAVPKLTIEAPEGRPPDAESIRVALRLTDDLGEPIPGATLDVVTTVASARNDQNVTTDEEGYWRGEVVLATATQDDATLLATAAPRGDHLGAEARAVVPVGAPLDPRPWLAIGIPVALLVVGSGAAATVYWARQRRRLAAVAPVAAPAPAGTSDLEIGFSLPSGEPPVLGVGERVEVRLTHRGAPADIRLEWGSGHRVQRLGAGETASVTLAFDLDGDVTFVATRPDGATATAVLRVVDYRKEVAREFEALIARSRALAPELGARTTPRELQWALEARLGPPAMHALDDIAEAMEFTNYSHYDVKRADYLRFVRGARALEPMIGGGAS